MGAAGNASCSEARVQKPVPPADQVAHTCSMATSTFSRRLIRKGGDHSRGGDHSQWTCATGQTTSDQPKRRRLIRKGGAPSSLEQGSQRTDEEAEDRSTEASGSAKASRTSGSTAGHCKSIIPKVECRSGGSRQVHVSGAGDKRRTGFAIWLAEEHRKAKARRAALVEAGQTIEKEKGSLFKRTGPRWQALAPEKKRFYSEKAKEERQRFNTAKQEATS